MPLAWQLLWQKQEDPLVQALHWEEAEVEAQMVPQMVHASETCQMLLHPEAQQQPSEPTCFLADFFFAFLAALPEPTFTDLLPLTGGRSTSHWCNAFSSLLQTHLLQLLRHSLSELAGQNAAWPELSDPC